jgi:hypothetical protein
MKYEEKYKIHPRLVEMNPDDLFNQMALLEDAELADAEMIQEGPPVRDLDPVRFYYSGLSQSEHAGGCLAFYRVLEYYAFLSNNQALNKLRHDHSVSDGDFARRVLQLVSINEKGPILALINKLTDAALLKHVNDIGLVKAASGTALGEEVYKFRNSIVHGKDSQGYLLHSTSVFDDGPDMMLWRIVLRTLAKTAIERYGGKLL